MSSLPALLLSVLLLPIGSIFSFLLHDNMHTLLINCGQIGKLDHVNEEIITLMGAPE